MTSIQKISCREKSGGGARRSVRGTCRGGGVLGHDSLSRREHHDVDDDEYVNHHDGGRGLRRIELHGDLRITRRRGRHELRLGVADQ